MPEATIIATLTRKLSGEELERLPPAVGVLEVRADVVGDLDPAWLRRHFRGALLYTLRADGQGGALASSGAERRARILAAEGYDLVSLDAERDLDDEILRRVPAGRRLISWRGPALALGALRGELDRLSAVEARLYQMTPAAEVLADALAPLRLLKAAARRDLIAFATGRAGSWSRILAPRFGAPFVFGTVGPEDPPPGELTVRQLVEDYHLPELVPVRELRGIVGRGVARSLSPRLHNAAYRALGLAALYLPFHAERFEDFWCDAMKDGLDALGTPLSGVTVTSPHKEAALAVAAASSAVAARAGAANALLRRGRAWRAETTDDDGVVEPLRAQGVAVRGRPVAVIGCGGAGRVAAVALREAGAGVTLVNRGIERGRYAARLLGLPFVPLADLDAGAFSIVVNATPCAGYDDEFPFVVDDLVEGATIVDLVYRGDRDAPTPLVAAVLARGRAAIEGREVLCAEVRSQFQLMTGRQMPAAAARAVLGGAARRHDAGEPREMVIG